MSEDYKQIALEDVKKGQRVRIVERHRSHIVTYEGIVVTVTDKRDQFYDPDVWEEIELGEKGDEVVVPIDPYSDTTILLLEDVPEPKIVSVQTVTITRYDDGTEKTEADPDGVWVPMRANGGTEWASAPTFIHTMEQFDAHEDYLKTRVLKDNDGYYWKHRNGEWLYGNSMELFGRVWAPSTSRGEISDSLPMTIVDNVGD